MSWCWWFYSNDAANPPPPLPYRCGLVLSIQQCFPPLPYGTPYYLLPEGLTETPEPPRDEVIPSRVEYLLANPPRPSPLPHPDTSTHSIEIIEELAVRDGRGPQVVLCRLDRFRELFVAKIYDPMYYEVDLHPRRVEENADRDYSCEAAAYFKMLQVGKDISTKYLPQYYGSWTFDLPLAGKKRQVRMILIAHVPGRTLMSLVNTGDYKQYSLDTRLELYAQAMEKCAMLEHYGVKHRDLEPRNVILSDDMTITIIDLGASAVDGLPNSNWWGAPKRYRHLPRPSTGPRPPSPLDISSCEMQCFVPEMCKGDDIVSPLDQWMRRRFVGSDKFEPSERLKWLLVREEEMRQERLEKMKNGDGGSSESSD